MADDVKVKFGGDFTDVPKGAEAAATAAGTKLKSWFSEGITSMMSSIGSAFALTALFDKLKENLAAAKEYFSELNHAIKTTGASGDEFQRVASLGKSVGVTMESVGRAMGFFAKNMGAASKDAHGHGKILRELGFTNEQITAGNISATDVLAALADQFQKTGNEALLASNSMALFGRGGREMLPIIQKGKDAILEQAKSLKVYSDAELEAAEASERASERRAGAWKKMWRDITIAIDKAETRRVVRGSVEGLQSEMIKEGKDYKGADSKEYGERLIKELKSKGVGLAIQEEIFKQMEKNYSPGKYSPFHAEAFRQTYGSITEALEKAKKEETTNKENKSATSAPLVAALAASSLQQIGGGDITSVMSGLTNNEIADNTRRTADATERMANKETPKPGPQTLR
jgi:hypothetical protein